MFRQKCLQILNGSRFKKYLKFKVNYEF